MYVQFEFLNYNGYSNTLEYKTKLDEICQNILERLEKELYDSVVWMIDFDPQLVLHYLEKLKSSLAYSPPNNQVLQEPKLFESIEFRNRGEAGFFDVVEQQYIKADVTLEGGKKIFAKELEDFSKLLTSQIDKLIVNIQWVFHKFFQKDTNYLEAINRQLLNEVQKQKAKRLIRENRIDDCIDFLITIFEENKLISNQLVMLARRYNKNKSDQVANIKSQGEIEIEENKIVDSMLYLIG